VQLLARCPQSVRSGSDSDLSGCLRHDRFTPENGHAGSPSDVAEGPSGGVRRRTRRSPALPIPSCDLHNEYSNNQHECHLKRGGHVERVPQDARSRTEVCEHEPGEIQTIARGKLPNGELQRNAAKPDGHENQAYNTSPAHHLPRQHIGGIAPYEQERKRSSAMAYKNERDRICYQQNSCERERHHGETMTFEQAVGEKHDA
jgi:hypothetical protein